MKPLGISLVAALSLCAIAPSQDAKPPSGPQRFHVQGTVTDPLGAVISEVEITFSGGQATRTVTTNPSGKFEVDLPVGSYTMKAELLGFRIYRRPLFLVKLPVGLTIDISLPVGKIVDRIVVGK